MRKWAWRFVDALAVLFVALTVFVTPHWIYFIGHWNIVILRIVKLGFFCATAWICLRSLKPCELWEIPKRLQEYLPIWKQVVLSISGVIIAFVLTIELLHTVF